MRKRQSRCDRFIRGCTRLALVLGMAAISQARSQAQDERPPALVAVSPVISRQVTDRQIVVGSVTPLKTSAVGSAVDGRVAKFPVNAGDRVKKGDALAELLKETISAQLGAAKAQLDLRKAELEELENGTRQEEIDRTKARMQAARATRDYAVAKLERFQKLFEAGRAVTVDQLEEAKSLADSQTQTYEEAAAEYALAVAGPRKEQILQARARVVEQEELVKQFNDQLIKHTMIAPFDGYVVSESTEVGQWVSRGELVATVAYLDEVHVEVPVPENAISFIAKGIEAEVRIPALNRSFAGTVDEVVPLGDMRSRTFPVRILVKNTFENDQPVLKAGMVAHAALPSGPTGELILIPKDAVKLGGPQPLVLVVQGARVDPENPEAILKAEKLDFKMVPVELTGVSVGAAVAVRGPLEPGQYVVSEGNERLFPGTKLKVLRVVETEKLTDRPDDGVPAETES